MLTSGFDVCLNVQLDPYMYLSCNTIGMLQLTNLQGGAHYSTTPHVYGLGWVVTYQYSKKKGDLTQSYDKRPYTNKKKNRKKQSDNTQTPKTNKSCSLSMISFIATWNQEIPNGLYNIGKTRAGSSDPFLR